LDVEIPLDGVGHPVVAEVAVDTLADEGQQAVAAVLGGQEAVREGIAQRGVRRAAAIDAADIGRNRVEAERAGGGAAPV
jgi:hypothetical protein